MSTINQWNTNFTYGEYLTSANMNSSSVGYICPGVYNADIYLRKSNSGSLSLVLKKGTTIIFSHVKDENGNMDFDNSYSYCTKCIVTEDTDYVLYNPDTDRNNTSLTTILKSELFFVYIMKKIVSTNDSSDYIPIIGLLTFDENGKRIEYTVPNIDISTEFDNESTKAYYQFLGVVINMYSSSNIFSGTGALDDSWIKYHIFTTRCLPSYSLRNSLYDHSMHNDIFFIKRDSGIGWNVNYKDLYINGNIYNHYTPWDKIYKWVNKPEDPVDDSIDVIQYNNSGIDFSTGTLDNKVVVDFLYAITNCEQSGPDVIENIFNSVAQLSFNNLTFEIEDEDIRAECLKRNFNNTSDSNDIEYIELYTDNSLTTINRLLDLLRGKNILPKLFNYIRYTRGTVNSDTIIPIAMCFRPKNVSETEKYVNTYLDPNNTLSFFDLQDGNYNLSYCKNSFQMADILSALDDNPYQAQ